MLQFGCDHLAAYWDEKDKRFAIAQIMPLADVPEVNSWSAHRLSLNLPRPLALLIEVKDAETDASDARLVQTRSARRLCTPMPNMPRTKRTKRISLVEKRARAVCAGLARAMESGPMQCGRWSG
jgi:hypothetical protein